MKNYSISIYLDTRRAKANGKYPVKLRVFTSYPRNQKLYSTIFDFSKEEFNCIWNERRPKKKYQEKRDKLQTIEQNAKKVANNLDIFTFEEFEKKLFRKIGDSTKIEYHYVKKIKELMDNKQIKTAKNYESSKKSFNTFSEDENSNKMYYKKFDNLTLYDITKKWLDAYETYMFDLGRAPSTLGMYLRTLRTIFLNAIEENDIDQKYYPFGKKKYQIPSSENIKKALTDTQLKILFNAKTKNILQQKAKDFWFFSFSCNGINTRDIADFKYKDIQDGKITFLRAKTKRTSKRKLKPIIVYLNEFSTGIIEKYGNKERKPDNYVFNIISDGDSAQEETRKVENFNRFISQHLKIICKETILPKNLSMSWARHSFATKILNETGGNIILAGESLGHKNPKTTMNYYTSFENQTIKDFSKSLMDLD